MDWQPIETAPKDGTAILVAGGHDDSLHHVDGDGPWHRFSKAPTRAAWDGSAWIVGLAEAGYVAIERNEPTHWMPLPAPPSARTTG